MATGDMVYEAGGSMAFHKVSGDMIYSNAVPSSCPYTGVTGWTISWTGYIWDSSTPVKEVYQPGGSTASPQTRYSYSAFGYCAWLSKTTPAYSWGPPLLYLSGGVWEVRFTTGFSGTMKRMITATKAYGATPAGSYTVIERNYIVLVSGWTAPIYNTIDNIVVT